MSKPTSEALREEIATYLANDISYSNMYNAETGQYADEIINKILDDAEKKVGGRRVYAPQGSNFEQQARCEQINAGITMAIEAINKLRPKQ